VFNQSRRSRIISVVSSSFRLVYKRLRLLDFPLLIVPPSRRLFLIIVIVVVLALLISTTRSSR
jgi:hypothetical protein